MYTVRIYDGFYEGLKIFFLILLASNSYSADKKGTCKEAMITIKRGSAEYRIPIREIIMHSEGEATMQRLDKPLNEEDERPSIDFIESEQIPSVESSVFKEEFQQRFYEAIENNAGLNEKEIKAILAFLNGETSTSLAKRFKVSVQLANYWLQRAKKKISNSEDLRQLFNDMEED